MGAAVQEFYARAKPIIEKDSDLPNFFAYFLTIELNNPAASVAAVKRCYESCDLHPPSWLASHFSVGLRSKPRRFIKRDGGYRLEEKLRDSITVRLASVKLSAELGASGGCDRLAGIRYGGIAGASKSCEEAVVALLQVGGVARAQILTSQHEHCILFTDDVGDHIAIKSGFSSGYGGQGPSTFSYVLQLLVSHGIEIDEYEVDESVIARIDQSALEEADLVEIRSAKPVPARWRSYISEEDTKRALRGTLWADFPPIIPLAIIDSRIIDLALSFWQDPDDKLLKGYRRLEDLIRKRTGVDEHGTKLLSQAFAGAKAKLGWQEVTDEGEKTGRASLFTGAFMAYRNPRAHRELKHYQDTQLAEFLLLNHLYRLEREAVSNA